jgi:hypothetical protein
MLLSLLPDSASFLVFSPEDRGDMLHPNVELSLNYTALQQEDHTLHSHHYENLKSNHKAKVWLSEKTHTYQKWLMLWTSVKYANVGEN